MLKNFKINKRDSNGSKGRITSADISTPTQVQDNSNVVKHVKTVPVRYMSGSSNQTSPSGSNQNYSPLKNRHLSRGSSIHKDISSPDKVIKALHSHKAKSPNELSFKHGDFFYVVQEKPETYEATNPSTGQKGFVQKKYFEVIDKKRDSTQSHVSHNSNSVNTVNRSSSMSSSNEDGANKLGSLYGIVLYDFKAEKSDELTAYVGENLFICAHHNFEWFIAKPIGRLGGPGLVPVGFVSIIDIKTGYATGNDVLDDIKSVNLPTIQEWKNKVAKYKASNITLGQVEGAAYKNEVINEEDEAQNVNSISRNTSVMSTLTNTKNATEAYASPKKEETIISASVDSFDLENEKYWFGMTCELRSGNVRHLKRYYQDFYDLQVQLLDNFPEESGKLRDTNGKLTKRIIPYIPGPVPYVTDTISKKRKEDLNVYVKDLISLPPYISNFITVRNLFTVRNNNYDREEIRGDLDGNLVSQTKDGDTAIAGDFNELNNSNLEGNNESSKNEDSTLTQDDLKLYDKMSKLSISSTNSKSRPPSVAPPPVKPTKIKFYYKNDIFALMLNNNTSFTELHSKIAPRIDTKNFKLQVKLSDGDAEEIKTDAQVTQLIQAKFKISVHDLD